jgi:hypothetical protein
MRSTPSEVHSPVEPQLADGVPQDGLLELHLAAFLGEERWSQVDCFLVAPLGCWPVRRDGCKAPCTAGFYNSATSLKTPHESKYGS